MKKLGLREIGFTVWLGVFISSTSVAAQVNRHWGNKPWPHLYNAVVQASTTWTGNNWTYSYTLYSSPKNDLPINSFGIDLRIHPKDHPFSRQDVTVQHSAEEHYKILTQALKIRATNTGSPLHWTENIGFWGTIDANIDTMLKPGQSLAGFLLETQEPPGIRNYDAEAFSDDFFNNPREYDFKGTSDELFAKANQGINYIGKTIAPVKPPHPFTIKAWTTRMAADVQEAQKLKWIKSGANLTKIQALIAALNVGDKRKLNKAVNAISDYVLTEKKDGRLTDEADALIRLNALYLLRRVKENKGLLKR